MIPECWFGVHILYRLWSNMVLEAGLMFEDFFSQLTTLQQRTGHGWVCVHASLIGWCLSMVISKAHYCAAWFQTNYIQVYSLTRKWFRELNLKYDWTSASLMNLLLLLLLYYIDFYNLQHHVMCQCHVRGVRASTRWPEVWEVKPKALKLGLHVAACLA